MHCVNAPPRSLDDLPLSIEEQRPLRRAGRVGIVVKLNLLAAAERHYKLRRQLRVRGWCFHPFLPRRRKNRMSACECRIAERIAEPV